MSNFARFRIWAPDQSEHEGIVAYGRDAFEACEEVYYEFVDHDCPDVMEFRVRREGSDFVDEITVESGNLSESSVNARCNSMSFRMAS